MHLIEVQSLFFFFQKSLCNGGAISEGRLTFRFRVLEKLSKWTPKGPRNMLGQNMFPNQFSSLNCNNLWLWIFSPSLETNELNEDATDLLRWPLPLDGLPSDFRVTSRLPVAQRTLAAFHCQLPPGRFYFFAPPTQQRHRAKRFVTERTSAQAQKSKCWISSFWKRKGILYLAETRLRVLVCLCGFSLCV